MDNRFNLYAYNRIQSATLDLSQDESYLAARVLNIESRMVSGQISSEEMAGEILKSFTDAHFRIQIDRVCIVVSLDDSRRLMVVSSANSTRINENSMITGYNCFVSPQSSLFGFAEGDARICAHLDKLAKNFESSNQPIQRSLSYLVDMGVKSSLTLTFDFGDKARGFLFLNSVHDSAFERMNSGDHFILGLIKIVVSNFLLRKIDYLKGYSFLSSAQREFKAEISTVFSLKQIVHAIVPISNVLKLPFFRLKADSFEEPFLFPLVGFVKILESIFQVMYNYSGPSGIDLTIKKHAEFVEFRLESEGLSKIYDSPPILSHASCLGLELEFHEKFFSIKYALDANFQMSAKWKYSIV